MRIPIVLTVVIAASLPVLAAPASAGSGACPAKPFTGSITRSEDTTNDQPPVELGTSDMKSALAFDFGSARNTTVYVATDRLDADDLGSTIEAPPGETIVTVFLRPKSGDLEAGKKLKAPRDSFSVTVDSGGGAAAVTSGARAKAQVLEFSDDLVCFSIDYRDDLQRVKGRVRAEVG